jgi:hypothetical protein
MNPLTVEWVNKAEGDLAATGSPIGNPQSKIENPQELALL